MNKNLKLIRIDLLGVMESLEDLLDSIIQLIKCQCLDKHQHRLGLGGRCQYCGKSPQKDGE